MQQTSTAGNAALTLNGVSRRYGDVAALDDVSLTVSEGEIICLAGRSGCGKSTLLRAVAGVETINRGSILIGGLEMSGPSAFIEPEKREIGFVFQDYALFPHLDVRTNILFGLRRLDRREAANRVDEVLERIGIASLANRYPHMLSGGEQQRVALARALAPRPRLLLMDEPFSNLDRGLRDSVREDTIALLRSLGTTVVMVTHDPVEALSAGDRVVLMKSGRIVQVGTGYALYDAPETPYAAEFFSAFNKIDGIYRQGHVVTPLGTVEKALTLADGSAVQLYVRPQDLQVLPGQGPVAARIRARTFLGGGEALTLETESVATPLVAHTAHRLDGSVGAVHLFFSASDALVFPAA